MNLSIDKKLFGSFGALFLAFVALALSAWIFSGRLNDRVSELTNVSGRSLQLAGDVQYLAANIKAGQRQVIILSAKQDMNALKEQARLVETDAQAIITKLDDINRISARTDARASAEQARTVMQTWMANDWRKTRELAERSQTLEAVEATEAAGSPPRLSCRNPTASRRTTTRPRRRTVSCSFSHSSCWLPASGLPSA